MKTTFPTFRATFTKAAALSGASGLSYALKIWTIKLPMANAPENWARKNNNIIMQNGLSVCLRRSSLNLSSIVGNGCVHFWACLMQESQDLARSLYCWSSLNSWATTSLDTQPRSQQSDFSASSARSFDNSHWGVSGICKERKISFV